MSELEKYEVLEQIGRGSFGIIRKVKRNSDGHVLCRKEISYIKMSTKEKEQLHAELSILSSLRHPNIVAYYHREHLKNTQDLHLYMEYCGNGDLGQIIRRLKATNQMADEEFVWSIFAQLVTALYRCHYGVNPPDVGKNVMVSVPSNRKPPKSKDGQVMILHRDLKPENVFLGEDNSVKLGDFGLSKIMQSHDFASTYVGTPFYMSPEICAAERYTLYSDVWSLGCIIYELCAKEPPFNAKTHFELVQKIKVGKTPPLPSGYSHELQNVINSCLKVNPNHRPDTAQLLNLPIVRLMRKEREVVELGRTLRTREDQAIQKTKEMESRLASMLEREKEKIKVELEAGLRREWEVKARLEIDRQVAIELEQLNKKFENEIQARVQAELQKQRNTDTVPSESHPAVEDNMLLSSTTTNGDLDFPSTTDLASLSLESPEQTQKDVRKRTARTPFSRSRTLVVAPSPMDVQMVDPSPMSIKSLSLSPRRVAPIPGKAMNIFAAAAAAEKKWEPTAAYSDDEDDFTPPLPSPTRQKSSNNPLNPGWRPTMLRQQTAPLHKAGEQTDLFTTGPMKPSGQPSLPNGLPQPNDRQTAGELSALSDKQISPNRRLSRLPSATTLATDGGSPLRKPGLKSKLADNANGGDGMMKTMMRANINSTMKGRTLVELQQARAGGRSLESADDEKDRIEKMKKRQTVGGGEIKFAAKMVEREVVWDPERDEMPSPFLVRGIKGARRY